MHYATRAGRIQPAATLALSARASELRRAGADVVNMGVGEPDFDTPPGIKAAALRAMHAGQTRYTPTSGLLQVREAICKKLSEENSLDYAPDEVMVTNGGKQAIHNAVSALVEPGDEVIIPAPYWVTYADVTRLCDGEPTVVPTSLEQGFRLTAAQLEDAINPRTRALFLNSPGNPSGAIYSKDELLGLGEVLRRHPDIWLISDDIYEHITLGSRTMRNMLNVCPDLRDRTVIVNGVSKAYAMTGWRIGFAAAPRHLIRAMDAIQSQTTGSPNAIAQAAAAEAWRGSEGYFAPMAQAYRERHRLMCELLSGIDGLRFAPSDGAFYLFANVEDAIKRLRAQRIIDSPDDSAFSGHLLNEFSLAVVPGSAFGSPGHVRLSFAASEEDIHKACGRLRDACAGRPTPMPRKLD